MYYELFSCSDVGHFTLFSIFLMFQTILCGHHHPYPLCTCRSVSHVPRSGLAGSLDVGQTFYYILPCCPPERVYKFAYVSKRVSVRILLTFCIADFSTFCHLPSICHVFTLTHWDLIGTMDVWRLWVSHLWA